MPFTPLTEKQADRAIDELLEDSKRVQKLAGYLKSLALGDLEPASFGTYIRIMIEHAHEELEEAKEEKGIDPSIPLGRSA